MNSLFQQLILEANKLGYELSDKELKSIYKLQKANQNKLLNEISKILLEFEIKEEHMNLSGKDAILLREKFHKLINESVKEELKSERDTTKELLQTVTKEAYNLRNYILSLGTIAKIHILSEKELWKIVNMVVDGEIWSDRLWKNKKRLEEDLRGLIKDFLTGRVSVNKIYQAIKDVYGNNAYCAKRLTETEICRVQEQANEEFAKQQGVEWMLFMATLDKKTSKKCRDYDGRIFRIDDITKPLPPVHPNCRSCMVMIPDKDWRPVKRRDNTTVEKHIDYTNYNKWKQENDIE